MYILNNFMKGMLGCVFLILIITSLVLPQPIGGPYTPDANTMLLMHFDGDLSNVSQYSGDGQFNGNPSSFYFLSNPVSGLGQCLRIDNGSITDQAYVTVADTPALSLTANWTIEGWMNIFTFGSVPGNWRWVPRLVIKTGDAVFWRPNYFVEMWGDNRFFSCGYHTASEDAWPQVNSPNNTFVPGQWYHMTFIRDTTRHILLLLIHDSNRDLIVFNAVDYLTFGAIDPTPIVTSQPVHIGYAGGGTDSYLDGFVDEIRISDVIREFPTPPVITAVTQLPNQNTSVPGYEIGANVFTLFSTTIASADVYYTTDGGASFSTAAMSSVGGDSMVATIPQQPLGTIIDYYVKAVDNQGMSNTNPQNAETDSVYYSFGIYQPNTMALHLDFEEGSGIPQDQSQYGNICTLTGTPTFSTNAAVGTYSFYFEGDSSYLEIASPFMASPTFTVDFWFSMDTLESYRRIVSLGTSTGSTNYMVFMMPDSALTAESSVPGMQSGLRDLLKLDQKIMANTWYHVRYQLSSDSALLQLWDASNNLVGEKGVGVSGASNQLGGNFRIGLLYNHTGYFGGYVDEVQFWNYPLDLPTGIDDGNNSGVPLGYTLYQNYPNPFNPTTEIEFTIPVTQNVKINIYDVLGRKVRTLLDKKMTSGPHNVIWDGNDHSGRPVASGLYFYRMVTKDYSKVQKMVLMK